MATGSHLVSRLRSNSADKYKRRAQLRLNTAIVGSRLNFNQKSPEKVILRTVLMGCKKVKKSNMEGYIGTNAN